MSRDRDFRALSPEWDAFIKPFSSKLRNPCRQEGRKVINILKSGEALNKQLISQLGSVFYEAFDLARYASFCQLHKVYFLLIVTGSVNNSIQTLPLMGAKMFAT